MKRKLALVLTLIMCFFSTFASADTEKVSQENKYITEKYSLSMEKDNGLLGEVRVVDSTGQPMKNGYVDVYSYLENKNVARVQLDENGYAEIFYKPANELILNELQDNEFLDTHYTLFIGNGEEVVIEDLTKTYYLDPNEAKDITNIKVDKDYKTKNKKETKSIKPQNIKNAKIEKIDETNTSLNNQSVTPNTYPYPYGTVISSAYMGSKPVKFTQISSTYDCTVEASITQGSSISFSGEGVAGIGYTAGSSVTAGTGILSTPYPCQFDFYTYFDFYEEYYYVEGGGYRYYFYRVVPKNWNAGINYTTTYKNNNAIAENYVSDLITNTWTPGSYSGLNSGNSRTFGIGTSLTGPLSGITYSASMTYTLSTSLSIIRYHGNHYYHEWGTDPLVTDRNIIIDAHH